MNFMMIIMKVMIHDDYASGGKTARVVVQIFLIVVCFSGVSGLGGGWWVVGGGGGVITSMLTPS